MRFSLAKVSRAYLALFGLINFYHTVSLLGLNESIVSAPPHLSFWWWHVILLLVYGFLPLTAVLMNSERLCLIVAGVTLAGILAGSFRVFTLTWGLHLTLLSMYALAALFSLLLAVENVSLKVAAERLSLEQL